MDVERFYVFVDLHGVCAFEGNAADEHFEKDVAEGPSVKGWSVVEAVNDLRGLVVDGTNEGIGSHPWSFASRSTLFFRL